MTLRDEVAAVADEMIAHAGTVTASEVMAYAERLLAALAAVEIQPTIAGHYFDHDAFIQAERAKIRREKSAAAG